MKVAVLLVGRDDWARTSLAERLLRSKRIDLVGQARNANEVAAILERADPDVVLVDLHRWAGRPAELCQELRVLSPAPLAVLASFMTVDRWDGLKRAGATDLLLKRVDTGQLERALTRLGAHYRALEPGADRTRPTET